ncbi:protein FAM83G-like [Xiphias gladius]|uniref:protein FAM83G-like n=1 Tax=Xiphias gladius TaxID=8245 RepID=UPI001A99DE48|nr:protein FAM83G-like [Xiphias gladius]
MALSQIQCLDDNHVNPRASESKPEFLYCEDQRVALEALLRDGREAFFEYLQDRGLQGFLSDPELETLAGAVEPYDPGSEIFPGNAGDDDDDDEPPLSLHYWPELSDTSTPQLDLGWPDSDAYRGVTRATVYTQPPLDGQAHIKEVVRKTIAQAQKVIAVVMDVFTDVDIFRDLLNAGFKRRVSVYILLERTALPHFLSMCQRANMHAGHLKHLRVRCTEGAEFYTRSCTKVRGQLGHRFMFIDGDKAVSGSYSFTWMSSRLDRNLITVVTGQAVDAFDRLFRFLNMTSSCVDLRQVATAPEPESLPQPATVAPPSAAVARKLYNPKYALVASCNPSLIPSAGHNSPKEPQNSENSRNPEIPETKKRRQRRHTKDAIQEAPPLHPGLTNLEKACLISYLPTWPEPDPPSDVIGFINIRDANKPTQVHLQRSEMFETSQAIRFSRPFSMPKETLPEVAQPRQLTAKPEKMNKLQPTQNKTKAEESLVDSVQPTQLKAEPGDIKPKGEAPEQKSSESGQKSEPDKDTTKALNTGNKLHSHTPINQDAGHNAHLNAQSSSKTSTPNTGRPSYTTQTVTTESPKPQSLPGSNIKKEAETSLNAQSAVVYSGRVLNIPWS